MTYRTFEANYLISLISATLTQRLPPPPVRATEWRELYYLSEYHDVSNISYYSLMGLYDQVPNMWRKRFTKVFRKWVRVGEIQEKEAPIIFDGLEDRKIDFVILKDWMMKRFYPQPDMRAVEDIEILIKPTDAKAVKRLMRELGYHHEYPIREGVMSFYKSVTHRIIFYQQLFPENRRLERYYHKVWKKLDLAVGYGTRYAFTAEDFYIYLIADICDACCEEDVDVRHMIDLYLYLSKYKGDMDWDYIHGELNKLELLKMSTCLEDLSSLWFGVYEGTDARQCRDVEEYIWSKGSYGRDTCVKLLPMIQDIRTWRLWDQRKAKIKKFIRWIFPDAHIMAGSFPRLANSKFLLPLSWLLRLLTMAGFSIKIRLIRFRRFILTKFQESSHAVIKD